jgi:hypothetical protein
MRIIGRILATAILAATSGALPDSATAAPPKAVADSLVRVNTSAVKTVPGQPLVSKNANELSDIAATVWLTKYRMRSRVREVARGRRKLTLVINNTSSYLAGSASERVINPWAYASFQKFYTDTILNVMPAHTRSVVSARAESLKTQLGSVVSGGAGLARAAGLGVPAWIGSLVGFLEMPLAGSLDNLTGAARKALAKSFGYREANQQQFADTVLVRFRYFDSAFSGPFKEISASREIWQSIASDASELLKKSNGALNELAQFAGRPASDTLYGQGEMLAKWVVDSIDSSAIDRDIATRRTFVLYSAGDVDNIRERTATRAEVDFIVGELLDRYDKEISSYGELARVPASSSLFEERARFAREAAQLIATSRDKFKELIADIDRR